MVLLRAVSAAPALGQQSSELGYFGGPTDDTEIPSNAHATVLLHSDLLWNIVVCLSSNDLGV